MVNIIIGNKGSGKTKKLIELTNQAVENSNGNVVVLDKGTKLNYDVTHKARLINSDDYYIDGFYSLYGFLGGICAGNYDVTDILIDSIFKICDRDFNQLSEFLTKAANLSKKTNTNLYLVISADKDELILEDNPDIKILNS